jgi:hypothetical protein
MTHRIKLEELVADGGIDLLIDIILKDARLNDALLTQIACMHKFKYEESQRQKKDIGWDETGKLWSDRGYAEAFRKKYNDEISFNILYKEITRFDG